MKSNKEKIAVMTAYENGEQIESRVNDTDPWISAPNPTWNWGMIDYRVKEAEKKYVDLGLPSGNLWGVKNEDIDKKSYFTYDEAMENFGNSLPSKEDFQELIDCCYHRWDKNRHGIEFLSENGNKIFFPAMGYHKGLNIIGVDEFGDYWSSTIGGKYCAYYHTFNNNYTGVCGDNIYHSLSVRLIKRK